LIFGDGGVWFIFGGWVVGVRGFDAEVVLGFKRLKPPVLEASVVGFPKLKPVDVASLLAGDEGAAPGLPNKPPLAGAEVKSDDFTGAGVEAGVVESGLTGSTGLVGSSIDSMSVSLEAGVSAIGALAALSRALPKLPAKKEFLFSLDGSGSPSLADLSALNVEPRLKGLEPNRLVGLPSVLLLEPLNGLPVSIAETAPVLGAPKTLGVGFDTPNMLPVEVGVLAAAAVNPPFDANVANPPEVGADVVPALAAPDPKTGVVLPSPDG
jgi:hypothetical protein